MAVPGAVTDPSRVHAASITYPSGSAAIEAYWARPRESGPHPALIVIHEAFGLNDHIRDLTRRFAQQGYIALAPQLYSRIGPPDPAVPGSVMDAMFRLPDAQAVEDLEAAIAFLRALPDVNGKVGCIGFCSGGRHTLLLACSTTGLNAAVDCWGGFILRASPNRLTTPARPVPVIDRAEQLACPLFIVGGAEDQNPSPDDLHRLAARLDAAGKPYQIKIYADAGHAFLADYRPSYREGPAFQLWEDIRVFLARHLKS